MAFVALDDASVLHPAHVRDLLIRSALTGVVQAKWSTRILDETIRSIVARLPQHAERLIRTRQLVEEAIPDGLVTGYEALEPALQLPDPDDRHVLAAAIRSHAQAIVTYNLKDFPATTLTPYGIEAQHPDQFMQHLIDLDAQAIAGVLRAMAAATIKPPLSLPELLDLLERAGLRRTATAMRPAVLT